MLDANLRTQLKAHLERLVRPVIITAYADAGAKSGDMNALLAEIAALSGQISLVEGDVAGRRVPSFSLTSPGHDIDLTFAGLPLGHEFTSLVLALMQVGGHPPVAEPRLLDQVRALNGEFRFETYFSLTCQNCPDVVQALNLMATLNPAISHVAIDGALFQGEVDARRVMSVPSIYLNGQPFAAGRMGLEQILAKLDTAGVARAAAAIDAKPPFDVLVVGGGPAGAAAAVYAARKGIRTGLVCDRMGGQVNDTMTIENFVSVRHTEGPKMAADLDAHVRAYGVDIMTLQQAAALETDGMLHRLTLESGATVSARTVILATGARWRKMGVPGEDAYLNKGVAFCPHCDGPLFKGKSVAVVGGGNSGVEAAIDLDVLASHVTLIEYEPTLRADAVLQRKLALLSNVTVLTGVKTTEVLGDGTRVTGLHCESRDTGEARLVPVDGVFVQIGLVPNTEWLSGVLPLSQRGEIVIDRTGQTALPGIFAAGDCTIAPYKQIVVAAGDGATAALAACDYLVRNPHDEPAHPAA